MHSKKYEHRGMNTDNSRIAAIETTLLHINTNLSEMRHSFENHFNHVEEKIVHLEEKIDKKINVLEEKIDNKLITLEEKIDKKFILFEDKIDKKWISLEDKVDKKFISFENKMDHRFEKIENRLWSNFLWLMSMIVGLAGLIAHTQHWV